MRNTKRTEIFRTKNWSHVVVYDNKVKTATSYQLLKRIPNSHYLYVLAHIFSNPIAGMFGDLEKVTERIEDLGHHVLYIHKGKKTK